MSKRYVITLRYFLYFMAMFFVIRVSQSLFWASYIVLPFLLWFKNINIIRIKQFFVVNRMQTFYLFFGILILFTALLSSYGLKVPLARFITVLSLFFFFRLSLIDLNTKEDFISALDGVIIAGMLYIMALYITSFNGFAFVLDEDIEGVYGNKNTAGNIIFLVFNLTIIRSYLSGKKWIFFILSTFLMLSALFTISLKCVTAAFFIYGFYLFSIRKSFSVVLRIGAIAVFLLLIPSLVLFYNSLLDLSPELQVLSDKLNIMIGNNDAAMVQYGFVDDRGVLIKRTWNLFLSRPLFGVGLENSRVIYDTYSHNTYVEILAGGGVLLFIPFMLFLWSAFRYLLSGLGKHSFLFVIFLCIIYISNALRIYDDVEYLFLLFALVKCKQLSDFSPEENENNCILCA